VVKSWWETTFWCRIRFQKHEFYHSLHDAETKNGGSTPHSKSTWSRLNLTDLSDGYNTGEYSDSWTIGNAGARNDKIDYPEYGSPTIDDQSVFNGGFAGNCPSGQTWDYRDEDGKWQCSGEIDWAFNYTVPDVMTDSSQATTGVFLDARIFVPKEDVGLGSPEALQRQSIEYSWDQQKDSTIELSSVAARCHAGTNDFSSVGASKKFDWKTESVSSGVGDKSIVGVTGDIDMSGHSQYTCEWNFTAVNQDTYEEVVFSGSGTPEELKQKHLDGFASFNGFDPSSLCSSGCDTSHSVSADDKQMNEFATAASLN
jgi:hypothetical protein